MITLFIVAWLLAGEPEARKLPYGTVEAACSAMQRIRASKPAAPHLRVTAYAVYKVEDSSWLSGLGMKLIPFDCPPEPTEPKCQEAKP